MAVNKLQLKRSAVAGKEPTTSSLALGELAINTYEGKVFLKKDNGVETIVQLADVSGSIFSASYAQTSSHSNNFTVTGPVNVYGSQYISGSLVVGNDITARRLVVQTITSSVIYSSGSNIFGDATSDTQTFTGSVNISGSLNLVGNQTINSGYELTVDDINVNTIGDRSGGTLTLTANTSSVSGFLTVNNSISASGKIEAVSFTGSFSGSINNLQGTATHIPYFSSSQVLANSAMYQVGSASIAINQDGVTTASPEALYVWQPNTDSFNVISGKGNSDNYLQLNIQNTNQGVSASSDVVATANNGDEGNNYINMGINGENFNGPIGEGNDAYLYSTGNNLHIGNTKAGKHLGFFVGGDNAETDKKLQLNPNNQHQMSGSLDASGSITATSFITRGATAAQFVKGDGSLDSTLYTSASVFNNTTSSLQAFSASMLAFTASTLVNSASFDTRINYISSSFNASTASFNAYSASMNAFSASMLSFTASQKNSNGTFATTGSNIFKGNQIITGSLSISGSTNIYGTTNITGSVNVSGSTGTAITANVDTIVFTGSYAQLGNVNLSSSVDITGSLVVNGRNYINDSSSFDTRINYISSSFNASTASINSFTASMNAFSASMLTTTASLNAFSSSVLNFTSSTLVNSASFDTRINYVSTSFEAATASLNLFSASMLSTTASINNFSASMLSFTSSTLVNSASFDTRINYISSSFEAATASLNLFSASVLSYTASNNATIAKLYAETSSLLANTASMNLFSASMLSYTASTNATIADILIETASLQAFTQSMQNFTASTLINSASFDTRINYLSSSFEANTASLNLFTASFNAFSSSILNTTASVNAFSASMLSFTSSQKDLNGTLATTGSNTFIGNQVISGSTSMTGSLSLTGSQNIIGNLTVTDTITAQRLVVQFITSSVAQITGSTKFGDEVTDTHQFTGSVLVSGSLVVNGRDYITDSGSFDTRINYISSSFEAATASLNLFSASILSYTASNNEFVADILTETASLQAATASLNLFSSSILNFTASTLINSASFDTRIKYISSSFEAATSSLNAFSASILSYTASNNEFVADILTETASLQAATASLNLFSASVLSFTASTLVNSASFDTRINYISSSFEASTASLNAFSASILSYTASNNEFVADILLETASLQAATASLYNFSSSILNYTASNNEVIAKLYSETASLNAFSASVLNFTASTLVNSASFDTRIQYVSTSFEAATASLNAFSASILTTTSSINNFSASVLNFTASTLVNSASFDTRINYISSSFEAATASLNAFSASILSYTASNNATIADILIETASLQAATASLQAATASLNLFSASMLSFTASQKDLNGTFATTGSNVFIGNQTVTGSLFTTGSNTLVGNTTLTGSLLISGSTTQIGNNTLTGNTQLTGSIGVSGSQTFVGTQTLTGSFLVSGSTTQIGNNTLFGDTVLSGSILISGSFPVGSYSSSVNIYGDTSITGYLKFNPQSTNIDTNVSASYIYVSGSTNDLYFTQNGGGKNNTVRLRWLEGNLYTGLLHGGLITATTGSTTFNLSSGSGIIVDLGASINDDPYPTIKYINWNSFTNVPLTYLTSSIQTFVGIDNTGNIFQQTTAFNNGQYNTLISIGTVLHQNKSTVNASITYPNVAYGWKQRSYDFVKAFGPLKLSGLTIITSGSLGLNVGSGTAFADGRNYQVDPNNPSYIVDPGTSVSKIFRYWQSGSEFVQDTNAGAGYTVIDPTQYNNGTALISVSPATPWTNQRVFWYPNSATKGIVVYYGRGQYASSTEALANLNTETFLEVENTKQNAVYLGSITIKYNGVFTTPADYIISPAGIFRSVGGSGGGGTVVTTRLVDLSDVSALGATSGQALVYDSTAAKWENKSFISASISGNAATATAAATASSADNFTVRGTLTAQNIVVQTITSSVDFVTGSTHFGTTIDNTHQFTGSVSISGSLAVTAGVVNNLTSSYAVNADLLDGLDSSTFVLTGSFGAQTASFNAFSASVLAYTASNNTTISQLYAETASILSYTASAKIDSGSVSTRLVNLEAFSSSLDATFATDADLNALSSSFIAYTASLNNFSASILNYTSSTNATISDIQLATASLYAFSASMNSYTASNNTTISQLYAETASILAHTASINAFSASINAYTSSNNDAITSLYNATASLNLATASLSSSIAILSGSFLSASSSFDIRINSLTESVFTHVVTNNGASNYIIDGVAKPILSFVPGATYRFDTTVVGGSHPFKFSTSPNGPTQYTTGVTSGSNYIQIEVNYDTPTLLYYYCTIHSGMGNEINVLRIENLVTTASFSNFSSSINAFSASILNYTSSTNAAIADILLETASFNAFSSSILNYTSSNNTTISQLYAETASLNAFSASMLSFTASQKNLNGTFATTGSNVFEGVQTINSNLVVTGSITAQTLVVQTITSSVDFVTGSTHFGTILENTHQFTGSVSVSGSLAVNDSNVILTNQTASMSVATASYWSGSINNVLSASYALTASHATNVPETASFANNATSASYSLTASFALNVPETSSFALTASYWSGSINNVLSSSYALTASHATNVPETASFANNATSASYALTASFALNVPLTSSFALTASYWSGSIQNAVSAAFADIATSASYSATASYALFALNGGGGGGGGSVTTYQQVAQATTWSISHFLNTQTPVVQVYDDSFNTIIPTTISNPGAFQTFIYFEVSQSGYAVLTTGGGLSVTGSNVILNQTVASTTWSFNHDLKSQYPVFTIFDNNDDVIIPQRIHANTTSSALIYFSTPRTGKAVASLAGFQSLVSSSISSSFATNAANTANATNAQSASYAGNYLLTSSFNTFSGSFVTYSGSINNRVVALENFSSSLDATFATDADVNAVSASLNAYTASNNTTISALYAQTSSINAFSASILSFTSSYNTGSFTGSFVGTASFADNATSASFASTASYWSGSIDNVLSASYAATASYADNFTVAGTLTAQTLVIQTITSSVIYSSGSNKFGNDLSNTQQLTGSVTVTGSLAVNGSNVVLTNQTASMSVATASFASTASFTPNAIVNAVLDTPLNDTIEFTLGDGTTSLVTINNVGTASLANTASFVQNAQTASYVLNAVSSSYAATASFALNGGGGGISAISIADEGILQGSASYFDFTGNGVSVVVASNTASFTISGGGSGTQGLTTTFTQSSAAVSWSFTHNLNTRTPVVQVYDSGYNQITPQYISSSNANEVVIGFGIATTGYAVISTGGALVVTGSNVILNQTASATTWSFNHGLNQQYPVFQVFNTDDEVIVPERIKAVDSASALIYFPTPVAGKAVASFAGLSGSIGGGSGAGFPFSGSAVITGSFLVSGSFVDFTQVSNFTGSLTGNLTGTASYATFALTASTAPGYTVQFSQTASAATWSFTHNMGTRNPIVQVYGSDYRQLIPNDIVGIDGSTVEVRFDYATTGYAILSNGGGLYITGSTSTLIQTSAATTWSFNHQLNTKYPAFEIYDENDLVIIPAGIKAIDVDNAEIYFAGAQAGRAIANFSGINGLQDNAVSASYASSGSVFHVDKVVMDRSLMDFAQVNSSIVGSNNMFTQATGSYTSMFVNYTVASGSNARSGQIIAVWNAGTTEYNDVSTNDIGNTTAVTGSVSIVSGEAQLNFQTNTSAWRIKSTATFM